LENEGAIFVKKPNKTEGKRMRKTIFLIVLTLMTTLCGCGGDIENVSDASSSDASQAEPDLPYTVITNPYQSLYNNASNVWDMTIHDGYLYVGAGDYDKNISPAKAHRYSLEEQKWSACGLIPDEQIALFKSIGGRLYIPGCDPTADWSMGNIYLLENDSFEVLRTIPNGVHCFDIVEFDGKLFVALGHTDTNKAFPVAVSNDGGQSFKTLNADSETLPDRRVYRLFPHGNELYALNGASVYKYDGEEFVYTADWRNSFVSGYGFYTRIPASAYFKGRTYFTTGYLFHFEDPQKLQYTIFENAIVTDLEVYGDSLYVLCAKPLENGNYLICLTKTVDGTDYETIKTIEYPLPALSFALDGNELYLGIGDISEENNIHKGDILKTEVTP